MNISHSFSFQLYFSGLSGQDSPSLFIFFSVAQSMLCSWRTINSSDGLHSTNLNKKFGSSCGEDLLFGLFLWFICNNGWLQSHSDPLMLVSLVQIRIPVSLHLFFLPVESDFPFSALSSASLNFSLQLLRVLNIC